MACCNGRLGNSFIASPNEPGRVSLGSLFKNGALASGAGFCCGITPKFFGRATGIGTLEFGYCVSVLAPPIAIVVFCLVLPVNALIKSPELPPEAAGAVDWVSGLADVLADVLVGADVVWLSGLFGCDQCKRSKVFSKIDFSFGLYEYSDRSFGMPDLVADWSG